MAYGIKYSCEWKSPMRDEREYIIEILERDYSEREGFLYPTGDVLTITQGSLDADELEVFRSSEAEVELLCVEDKDPYMSLFTTDALKYKLRIMGRGPEGLYNEWEGFLAASTYVQDYKEPPYHVRLRAVDGLAILKDIKFLDIYGDKYSGLMTLDTIVRNILANIPNGFDIVYNLDDNIVEPVQSASTMELLSLDASSIYTSFGDDIPSCYDVLEAILKTMQLQIFQSYGEWHIRSIASLYSTRSKISSREWVNFGGKVLPLYSDDNDDTGVSVAASLSLLAPLHDMTVQRSELEAESEGGDYPKALRAAAWVPCFKDASIISHEWRDKMRIKATLPKRSRTTYAGAVLPLDIVVKKSPTTSLTFTADVYNLHTMPKKIKVAIFAYNAYNSIKEAFISQSSNMAAVGVSMCAWDASNGKWTLIDRGIYNWSNLDFAWQEIELPAAKHLITFDKPSPLSYMVRSEIAIEATSLDIVEVGETYRFIVCIIGADEKTPLSAIELRNPTLVTASTIEELNDIVVEGGEICPTGLGEATYEQHFADGWMLPTPGFRHQAPLVYSSNGDMMRGLVAPMQRTLLADSALSNMRTLRGNIVRQLEGEVYSKTCIDLDTKWQGRDGRRYYTNYIRRHLRRGIYSVQLRELPAATAMVGGVMPDTITNIVGLDSSYFVANGTNGEIRRVDLLRNTYEIVDFVDSQGDELRLTEGQRCACIIRKTYNADISGYDYNVIAYDTDGKELSSVIAVQELFDNVPADAVATLAYSARYDANVGVWTFIAGITTATYTLLLSRDGGVIASKSYTGMSYLTLQRSAIIPNGFALSTYSTKYGDSIRRLWWHSNAKHVDAEMELFGTSIDLLAGNEKLFVVSDYNDNKLKVLARTDIAFGFQREALYELDLYNYSFVTMNNALVVFKKEYETTGTELIIFDARTGRRKLIHNGVAMEHAWLSGNVVYIVLKIRFGYSVIAEAIVLGDGDAFDPYRLYDGGYYITADGFRYLITR